MRTRLMLAIAAVAAMFTGTAFAADLARPAPVYKAPPPPIETCVWCGFYIGGDIGGYWARQSGTTVPFPSPGFGAPAVVGGGIAGFGNLPTAHNLNRSGAIGGGYVGFNWQWGGFVAGLEADVSALSRRTVNDTETVFATFPGAPASAFNMTLSANNTWLATARARAGVAWDRTLWYVTGGAAWTNTSYTAVATGLSNPAFGINTIGTSAATSFSDTRTGFVVGAGVEWMFAPNWILRAEYLYHQFSGATSQMALVGVAAGGGNTCVGGGGAAPCNWAVSTSNLQLNVARVGLSYKFGGGPVVARY